ncbi:MAG: transglutaminase domain-containing protein, partial [Candidatus Omnitrophica bacterium]|nr:transglutaminase domain-containing protein [Candidatus Omnitrophota bacterium]
CFNKANLQIALLRKSGLPAGYGVSLIHREVFQPLLPEDLFQLVSEPTVHVYAFCYLDSRWVACDATIDAELYIAFYQGKPDWDYSPWDGVADYRLSRAYLVEEQGIYSSIDLFLLQPPRFWTDEFLSRANCFLEENIRRKLGRQEGEVT